MIRHLECVECGTRYQPRTGLYTCSACGIRGILDVVYDYERAAPELTRDSLAANGETSLWRYLPLLPVESRRHIQPLQVGWTPLYRADRLAGLLELERLYVKDDGRNPTGSFKDRASAVGVVRALEEGATVIAASSTGNAASSLAGFAASAGIRTFIFVPEAAPEAKLTQLLVYGANVIQVEGTYDEAYYLCEDAVARWGWYNRNCAVNPYLIEGKKTVAFEIAEQLGWQVPDWVVMAVGDGCSLAGAGKGFRELLQLGLIDRVPRLLGVQAEGSAPLADAFERGDERIDGLIPDTLADSIAVGKPRNGAKLLRQVRSSGGLLLRVSDAETLEAMMLLARQTGVFAEPAGTAAMAGLVKARQAGIIDGAESVVVVATGNGLKDVKSARQVAGTAWRLPPKMADLAARVEPLLSVGG